MRIRTNRRALLLLIPLFLLASILACNLTTTPPTPTARATPATAIPTRGAPTLFASITPLPGGGASGGGGNVPTLIPPNNCPPPTGWVQYIVQNGDSLAGLADATGSTVEQLGTANCIADTNIVYVGQVLYLPRSPISG